MHMKEMRYDEMALVTVGVASRLRKNDMNNIGKVRAIVHMYILVELCRKRKHDQ